MVAMNSTLSDLSFLAIAITPGSISPDTLPGTDYDYASAAAATRRRRTKSGQQSSVGTGSRHQLPWPGRPGFPAASPPPHSPTDDCSPLHPLAIRSPSARLKGSRSSLSAIRSPERLALLVVRLKGARPSLLG